ncbi:MAG: type II secretion system protein GspM [Allosphingosinicella sp.]|uniref:type II secretion system protein GspM n=1 Tax=Allosphingosinicella sp. TaxID=2823234 RepID=UPI00394B59BD
MNEAFLRWWQQRSTRERRLLVGMVVLAVLVLLWLLAVRPLGQGLAEARQRHAVAVLRLAETRAAAEALRQMETAAPAPLGEPVEGLLSRSAAEAGLPIASLTADGPAAARIAIPAARPQAVFAWVADMEARGLSVERLSATPNEDRTLAVEATFRARGG